jgi:hypothetical protein
MLEESTASAQREKLKHELPAASKGNLETFTTAGVQEEIEIGLDLAKQFKDPQFARTLISALDPLQVGPWSIRPSPRFMRHSSATAMAQDDSREAPSQISGGLSDTRGAGETWLASATWIHIPRSGGVSKFCKIYLTVYAPRWNNRIGRDYFSVSEGFAPEAIFKLSNNASRPEGRYSSGQSANPNQRPINAVTMQASSMRPRIARCLSDRG